MKSEPMECLDPTLIQLLSEAWRSEPSLMFRCKIVHGIFCGQLVTRLH